MDAETLEAARAVAFRFLGYAARSRNEIERRLEREGIAPDVIAAVVEEFTALGWLDDTKFAQAWVEDRADRKRYGRQRLKMELLRKGIDKETLDGALGAVDEEAELARARAAVGQRWSRDRFQLLERTDAAAEKKRCSDFLQRRGFGWSIITKVLAELVENRE